MRGLKLDVFGTFEVKTAVASLRMRGLKLEVAYSDFSVVSCRILTDAWIEILPLKFWFALSSLSHPYGCVD